MINKSNKSFGTTYNQVYQEIANILTLAGIQSPSNEAYLILEHVSGLTKAEIILRFGDIIDTKILNKAFELAEKRSSRIPLQHLLGYSYFYSRKFRVNPNVLVPRFDSEVLIDVFEQHKPTGNAKVLDLCTGSGCIGITLDLMFENIAVTCSDISQLALEVCNQNKLIHNSNVNIVHSDMFDSLDDKYDYIICNPPYISIDEIETLEPEVKDYDPIIALTDNKDGLSFYKIIADNCSKFLNNNGYLILEIGCNQFEDVRNILLNTNLFSEIKIYKDMSNLDRVVLAH